MVTLVGKTILVNLTIWVSMRGDGRVVSATLNQVKCTVLDDQFIDVGDQYCVRKPLLVDCWQDIKWVKPLKTDGTFLIMEDSCE